jgi:hypothetical protein
VNDADKKDFMSFNFLSSHSVVPKSINSGSLLAGKKIRRCTNHYSLLIV